MNSCLLRRFALAKDLKTLLSCVRIPLSISGSSCYCKPAPPPPPQPGFKLLKIWEPSYLDEGGPTTPMYSLVNIQIKGYDFPILESYGKFIHNSATRFGIEVEDSWGTPCKKYRITKLKPESSHVDTEYILNQYDRTVQLAEVPSTLLPLFINFIEAALPTGVLLDAHLHEPAETEIRYIPDHELAKLKTELETLKAPTKK